VVGAAPRVNSSSAKLMSYDRCPKVLASPGNNAYKLKKINEQNV